MSVAEQPSSAAISASSGRFLTVCRSYHFEAGHFLPNVRDGHKCKRQHGHNYRIEVTLSGPVEVTGFILDFWDMDKIVNPIVEIVDHRNLNDIAGLENPTAENITGWFFDKIDNVLSSSGAPITLISVAVHEVEGSYAKLEVGSPQQAMRVIHQLAGELDNVLSSSGAQKNGTAGDPKLTGSRIDTVMDIMTNR